MSDGARHGVVVLLGAGLLGALFVTRAAFHGPLGALALTAALLLDPAASRRAGAPRRWVMTALLLGLVGLWLGPRDAHLGRFDISLQGALAATTMVSRAIGIVLLGAGVGALYPPARALGRLRGTRFRRFAEVLLVALDLAPSLVTTLESARREVAAQHPGLLRAPRRLFETFVIAVLHATTLADSVARGLASGEQER